MTEKPTLKKSNPVVDKELMEKYQKMIHVLKNDIATMETNLKKMDVMLDKLLSFNPLDPNSLEVIQELQENLPNDLNVYKEDECEVIEGLFDGYFMIGGDEKKYPVPMNYSSKTKLVP